MVVYSAIYLLKKHFKEELKELSTLGVEYEFTDDGWMICSVPNEMEYSVEIGFYGDFAEALAEVKNKLGNCDNCGILTFYLFRNWDKTGDKLCWKCDKLRMKKEEEEND
jgi:hypothetical protein